jgi:hypothetical protein
VWGFTIPSLACNSRVRANINIIDDAKVRDAFCHGEAYLQASEPLLASLTETAKTQLRLIHALLLRNRWYTAIAFSLLGFLFVFVEKRIKSHEELQTESGLKDEDNDKDKTKTKDEEVAV